MLIHVITTILSTPSRMPRNRNTGFSGASFSRGRGNGLPLDPRLIILCSPTLQLRTFGVFADSVSEKALYFSVFGAGDGNRTQIRPSSAFRKCLNLLTDHPQFGRIWAQNFASGRRISPTLSTASRCASPITWP